MKYLLVFFSIALIIVIVFQVDRFLDSKYQQNELKKKLQIVTRKITENQQYLARLDQQTAVLKHGKKNTSTDLTEKIDLLQREKKAINDEKQQLQKKITQLQKKLKSQQNKTIVAANVKDNNDIERRSQLVKKAVKTSAFNKHLTKEQRQKLNKKLQQVTVAVLEQYVIDKKEGVEFIVMLLTLPEYISEGKKLTIRRDNSILGQVIVTTIHEVAGKKYANADILNMSDQVELMKGDEFILDDK